MQRGEYRSKNIEIHLRGNDRDNIMLVFLFENYLPCNAGNIIGMYVEQYLHFNGENIVDMYLGKVIYDTTRTYCIIFFASENISCYYECVKIIMSTFDEQIDMRLL